MIPTAEEWLKINYEANAINPNILIEFAKLHVKEALKQAWQNASATNKSKFQGDCNPVVDDESILNAYPLTNIK
jgi:hypothetical protein